LLNIHYDAGAQSYALDIVALAAFGRRASGILPKRSEAYAVFDQPVYAPCGGKVISATDGFPDLSPPERDSENIAGNFVVLACDEVDATIFLAHLRQGSIVSALGSVVARGEQIARVGNSGNTTEPHLHIHAVRGIEVELRRLLRDAQAVPMRFDGRFLVRNDRNASYAR
jgi:murein DD-endopeptidase MepM/ murein hydrolase activator NlpD